MAFPRSVLPRRFLPRSFLYVPGDKPDMIAKAGARGADALILDLEDAVAAANKDAARAVVADALGTLTGEVWVRINSGERMAGDVAAVVRAGLHGLVVAKADADALAALDEIAGVAEERAGLARARIRVCPLVEHARAVLDLPAIASAARVSHLALGEVDLAADLGSDGSDRALDPIRMQAIVASAAAGIGPPTAPVSTDFRDLDALRTSTEALKAMGFGARAAIHPAQVPVINWVFTPTAEEVERARDVLARSEAAGGGVAIDRDGTMLDEAVVRGARRVLERAAD